MTAGRAAAGPLVKEWRLRRGRSQMDLAFDVGVSPRHLSFVETGRSKPSPELLLALAAGLEIPLRERNTLLLAAGYAPRYPNTSLADASMVRVRQSLEQLLERHSPYPGIVIDRLWNSVLSNDAANQIVSGLPDALIGPPTNVFRISLHPDGLAARTLNFPEWAAYLLGQLHRLAVVSGDPTVLAMEQGFRSIPTWPPSAGGATRRRPRSRP